LGLLNSKLIYIRLYNKGKRKGESLELYQKPLSEIPIFKAEVQDQNDVIDLVENIINSKDNTISDDYNGNVEKLDMVIYKLYNLSESEIKYIESFYHSKQ
jgi:adenine-specific DNA-methyltransferase